MEKHRMENAPKIIFVKNNERKNNKHFLNKLEQI